MLKKLLLLGVISGLLAGIASIVYQRVYAASLGEGFTETITVAKILGGSVAGTLIAALGYALLSKVLKSNTEPVFNLLFAILSFVTILAPFAAKLPMTIEAPELFPGLAIPMHLFPAMAWFTLKPLFAKSV